MSEKVQYGKYSFEVRKRDKIFFADEEFTKGDLIEYYEKIADTILPFMKDRPLTMIRFPNGIDGKRFYQKDAPDYFPDWIKLKSVKKQGGGKTDYVICNNKATLIYLANQACITPHLWLSKKDKLDYPDRMIFDLDPPYNDFSIVKSAARKIKKLLGDELDLPVYLMTTGSRGLHVVIPLKRKNNFDEVRNFARDAADFLADQYSNELTTVVRKNKRGNRLFLDTGRNAFGQTSVTPYAVRPKKGAPVATPVEWNELSRSSLNSQSYNIKNIFSRLSRKDDPWKDINKRSASLSPAKKKLEKLKKG